MNAIKTIELVNIVSKEEMNLFALRVKVINFSVGIWKRWQYAATHGRSQSTFVANNLMYWIQVAASKLFRRIIIAAIIDNSDKLTIE